MAQYKPQLLASLAGSVYLLQEGIPVWVDPSCHSLLLRDGRPSTNHMPSVILCGAHLHLAHCPTHDHYERAISLGKRGIV